MKKGFLLYGTVICLIFAYTTQTGWNFSDLLSGGKWGPKGQSGFYHK